MQTVNSALPSSQILVCQFAIITSWSTCPWPYSETGQIRFQRARFQLGVPLQRDWRCYFLRSPLYRDRLQRQYFSAMPLLLVAIGHFYGKKFKGKQPTPKTTHPNKKSLRKQFSGLFVQTVLSISSKLNKRHAERVWANCLRRLFSVGFIGVGGFWGWVFSLEKWGCSNDSPR